MILYDPEVVESGPAAEFEAPVLTVSELLGRAREVLEHYGSRMVVRGELAGWRPYPSGHCYGTLTDPDGQLSLVMYRREAQRLEAAPTPGLEVLAFGRLTVYGPHGKLQFAVSELRLGDGRGLGALARDRLIERLRAEGLLAAGRKRPLPAQPSALGIVTSARSAALGDIVEGVRHRAPWVRVVVAEAPVTGPHAPERLSGALRALSRSGLVQVVVLARGGGSTPDLAPFDTEEVARAIASSPVPVISAVGHDLNSTVADAVADARAATPSAAVTLAVPDREELRGRLAELRHTAGAHLVRHVRSEADRLWALRDRLPSALSGKVGRAEERVRNTGVDRLRLLGDQLLRRLGDLLHTPGLNSGKRHLVRAVRQADTRIGQLRQRLPDTGTGVLRERERRFAEAATVLDATSPVRTLARGYAVVEDSHGESIESVREVVEGDEVVVRMRDGQFRSRVTAVEPEPEEEDSAGGDGVRGPRGRRGGDRASARAR